MEHAYTLKPGLPTPGWPSFLRPPIALQKGTGILTCFPSTTHFCLALGADSPCADERCAGNLGFSVTRNFTLFIATHVSIRTSDTSSRLHNPPSQAYGTLLYHMRAPLNTLLHLKVKLDFDGRFVVVSLRDSTTSLNALKGARISLASVHSLSPVTSSAQDDSTSELLRFL